MPSLMDLCVSELAELLAPVGWARVSRRHDVFRFPATGALVWQLAANGTIDRRSGSVSFLPALGVRHPEAVDLEGAFLGLSKSSGRFAATIGCGLMELLPPDGRKVSERWRVSEAGKVKQVMAIIYEDFFRYGLPYYQKFETVDSLIEYLTGCSRSQDQDAKLAILNALCGRTEEALSSLAAYAAVTKGQSPPISVQSWRFMESFVERFGLGRSLLSN
jgi:hypothetical protein